MRHNNATSPLDWISISQRWLILLTLAVSLAAESKLSLAAIITIAAGGLWNALLTLLVAFNQPMGANRYRSVAVDLAVTGTIFYLNGSFQGDYIWVGLLPVLPALLNFNYKGVLLIAAISLAFQGVISLITHDLIVSGVYVVALTPAYLVIGFLLYLVAQRLVRSWNRSQHEQLASQEESERAERERNRAIYRLVTVLNASLNYQRVLETSLDLGYSALATGDGPDLSMVSAVLLFTQDEGQEAELRVGTARRFTQADLRISMPGTSGLIGQTIDDGISKLGKDLAEDPELKRVVALRGCSSAYCVPLRAGLETYGVLLFAHPEPDYFTIERREILDLIGNTSVVAFQNARLYQDLELEKERMIEVQEEVRKKLARDLHDGPTQSVAALAMRANFTRRLMDRDPKSAAEEMQKIEDLARRTTKEIRHMLFTLRPLILESKGLIAAFESMSEKMRETYNQNVIIEADPEIIPDLELGKQGVIFNITEEAVTNARKHANARHIWVRLKPAEENLARLEIEDDGEGFDVELVGSGYDMRGSLGMINMRERTELINGALEIESAKGKGTRVEVLIPLTEDAADRIRRGV